MKRDIYYIDWASEKEPLDTKMLKANSSWILPQLSAFLGKLPLVRNDANQFSASLSLKRIASEIDSITFSNGMPVTRDAINGMLKFVLHTNRSDILSGTQLATPRYSSAVPFLLSAFKEQRNIDYSRWDTTDKLFSFFVEHEWFNALITKVTKEYSPEDLLEFRAKARNIRTGAKAGTERSINATTNITRSGNTDFDALPKYWKLALCQTWVFHPSNRHPLAITNPYNIDIPAEPLVSGEIFETKRDPTDWDKMWDNV